MAVVSLAMPLAGCAKATGYEGRWIAIGGKMDSLDGYMLSAEDVEGLEIELNKGGEGNLILAAEPEQLQWTLDENTVTFHVLDSDMEGIFDGDTLTIQDMLGAGMDIIFAREGSEAADAALQENTEEE